MMTFPNSPSDSNENVICVMSIPSFLLPFKQHIKSCTLVASYFSTDFVMYSNALLLAGATF